jgi:signal transduction histidine kinase
MQIDSNRKRTVLSWLFVTALLVLCGVLGALQYRWIGEVSIAERERLRKTLQMSLDRLSSDFNAELWSASQAIVPARQQNLAQELTAQYEQWKKGGHATALFRRIGLAEPTGEGVSLRILDPKQGDLQPAGWPEEWKGIRARMEGRLNRQGQAPPDAGAFGTYDVWSFEAPVMDFGRRELGWVVFELNPEYVRETLLPELLQRDLGAVSQDYQVEVLTRSTPAVPIYQNPMASSIGHTGDAYVSLFDLRIGFPGGRGGGRRGGAGDRGPGPGFGRWQMSVRHRNGSLEAVVARTRMLNLLVTAGVLILMLASVAALFHFTRRAQKLAQLQLDFVAGVSHELRTPLTVIHTAAYNLRGKMANNPAQVERYGTLIQQESGRLKDMVEQLLRFSSANAGHVIQQPEPVSMDAVIAQATESGLAPLAPECVLEKHVDPDLPVVLGDGTALKQALQNLLSNAIKYGTEGGNWIGITASRVSAGSQQIVEVRVQDHGPGIPQDEQAHVFDPFFRGRRAKQDQVHGTGLGLNLVKKIVEAHGGSVAVRSDARKGTEFIVQLPAAPAEYQNGFAHTAD